MLGPDEISEEVFGDETDSVAIDGTTYILSEGEVVGIVTEEASN